MGAYQGLRSFLADQEKICPQDRVIAVKTNKAVVFSFLVT